MSDSSGVCVWCRRVITMQRMTSPTGRRDNWWVDDRGLALCSPEDRGATCSWSVFEGPDDPLTSAHPLTIENHDRSCSCQFAFQHTPRS